MIRRRLPLLLSLALALPSAYAAQFTAAELDAARALQARILTLDSHLDTPANFERPDFDIRHDHSGNALSQVDLPGMDAGLLDGGFDAGGGLAGDGRPDELVVEGAELDTGFERRSLAVGDHG